MSDPLFVGPTYVAASITQDDQECFNWYPEIDSMKNPGTRTIGVAGERGVIALYPTPGLTLKAQLQYGEVRGLYPVTGGNTLLAVSGNTVYALDSGFNVTTVGTLYSNNGQVSITDNGVSAYLVDGLNRYTYDLTSGAFATIASSDGAFTGGEKCGVVDDFIYYNNPGTSQWGCTNALSTVSGNTNFASVIGSPNDIITLFDTNREIFLLGEKYTEPWIDVGSFPFPFAVIPGTSMQHGCAAKYSPARLGEAFAFLARDDRGQCIVIQMNGYAPERISNFAVENAINNYPTVSDAIGFSYQQAGHEFYVLTFPSADVTWVFDIASGLWHKRSWIDSNGKFHRHRANCCAFFQGQVIVGDWQNGMLYKFDQFNYTDNGNTIRCMRRGKHSTADLKRIFYNSLQLQFQPGVGLTGNSVASGINLIPQLGSQTGEYVSTPNAPANQITGDIEFIAYVAANTWAAGKAQPIVAKLQNSNINWSYDFIVTLSGKLAIQTSPDGTIGSVVTSVSSVLVPAADGSGIWLRGTLKVNNGAGGNTATFYISNQSPTTVLGEIVWTQLGTPVINAGTTSIFSGTSIVEISSLLGGAGTLFSGDIYAVYVFNGIGGPWGVSMVANDGAVGASSFTSKLSGEVWTIHQLVAGVPSVKGNYVPATQGADPQAMLKWSDDGGSTWSNEHLVSLGKKGAYKNRALWRQLGQARDRIFEVAVTDPVYRVLVSAELIATPGAH